MVGDGEGQGQEEAEGLIGSRRPVGREEDAHASDRAPVEGFRSVRRRTAPG